MIRLWGNQTRNLTPQELKSMKKIKHNKQHHMAKSGYCYECNQNSQWKEDGAETEEMLKLKSRPALSEADKIAIAYKRAGIL